MKKFLIYALVFILGILASFAFFRILNPEREMAPPAKIAAPTPIISPTAPLVEVPAPDQRLAILKTFLEAHNCVDASFSGEYLAAADANGLDYRLMPALSVKEESCRRNISKNNLWGWESGAKSFPSIPAGIDFLAAQLHNLRYYAGKTTDQKLRAYNNHAGYAESVEKIMATIGPK